MANSTQDLQEHEPTFVSLLTHYEKMFYESDEGLVAIFEIGTILLQKLKDVSGDLLHVVFQIAINVQATRSIPGDRRSQVPAVFELLANKGGFMSVAELNASEIGPII